MDRRFGRYPHRRPTAVVVGRGGVNGVGDRRTRHLRRRWTRVVSTRLANLANVPRWWVHRDRHHPSQVPNRCRQCRHRLEPWESSLRVRDRHHDRVDVIHHDVRDHVVDHRRIPAVVRHWRNAGSVDPGRSILRRIRCWYRRRAARRVKQRAARVAGCQCLDRDRVVGRNRDRAFPQPVFQVAGPVSTVFRRRHRTKSGFPMCRSTRPTPIDEREPWWHRAIGLRVHRIPVPSVPDQQPRLPPADQAGAATIVRT